MSSLVITWAWKFKSNHICTGACLLIIQTSSDGKVPKSGLCWQHWPGRFLPHLLYEASRTGENRLLHIMSHWIRNFLLPQKYVRTIFLAQELGLLEKFVLIFWMLSRTKPSDNYFLSLSSRILFQKITSANLAVKGLSSTHPGVLHPLVPCILGRRCFWSCTTKNWSP